ncbi:MAG: helix-hairpin-helix domain-containing protein [Suipraeoptans sp.]
MRKKKMIFFTIALLLIFLYGCKKDEVVVEIDEEGTEFNESILEDSEVEASFVYVHICGHVNNPGVYELKIGSRYFEVIELAGGFSENANESTINLAKEVQDGERIYIPSVDEISDELISGNNDAMEVDDGKININSASKEELMTLTGIGEAKASDIVRHREEQGTFDTIEDIKSISGIKDGVFEKIKDKIKVE